MRITRDSLLQTTRNFVAQQTHRNRRMVCIYLAGSLLTDEPLLGGNTDIDLFFIHDGDPPQEREVFVLSNDVHFDIAHLPQSLFRQPRDLRTTPWIAPTLCSNPICMHDTQHWFEFTQASVCAQFQRPEYRMERARIFAGDARQHWLDLKSGLLENQTNRILTFTKSLEKAANAIASLSGSPLTERRFLLQFPQRAEQIGRPGLAAGLVDIILPQPIPTEAWSAWLTDWEATFLAAGKTDTAPARLHPARLDYYKKAADALREDYPAAALWFILQTWTLAASLLKNEHPLQEKWKSAVQFLGLDPDKMDDPLNALDIYIDNVEETLDVWGQEMGL